MNGPKSPKARRRSLGSTHHLSERFSRSASRSAKRQARPSTLLLNVSFMMIFFATQSVVICIPLSCGST